MNWTPAQLDQLVRLTGEGMSAGQIAKIMNLTRNQIIGKIDRMDGMFLRGSSGGYSGLRASQRIAPKPLPAPIVTASAPVLLGFTMMALEAHHCRFPHGERNFTFCGHDKATGSQYCIYHSRIVYAPKHPTLAKLEGR